MRNKFQIPNSKFQILTHGFTLIELLVVISIIGILAGMAVVSFTSSQKQARDTARKSDLSQYRTTLEAYANKNGGLYPVFANATSTSGSLCTTLNTSLGLTGTCPEDAKSPTSIYQYCSNSTGTDYVLWSTLENVNSITYWVNCSNGKSATSINVPTCGGSFNCFP